MVPICSKRMDMDEEEVQKSLVNHEAEKRYEQLKERNECLKKEIAMVCLLYIIVILLLSKDLSSQNSWSRNLIDVLNFHATAYDSDGVTLATEYYCCL